MTNVIDSSIQSATKLAFHAGVFLAVDDYARAVTMLDRAIRHCDVALGNLREDCKAHVQSLRDACVTLRDEQRQDNV